MSQHHRTWFLVYFGNAVITLKCFSKYFLHICFGVFLNSRPDLLKLCWKKNPEVKNGCFFVVATESIYSEWENCALLRSVSAKSEQSFTFFVLTLSISLCRRDVAAQTLTQAYAIGKVPFSAQCVDGIYLLRILEAKTLALMRVTLPEHHDHKVISALRMKGKKPAVVPLGTGAASSAWQLGGDRHKYRRGALV